MDHEAEDGYFYIATGERILHVKIGYWKGTIRQLLQRYQTYFGSSVILFCFPTPTPFAHETLFKTTFPQYHISFETYEKSLLNEYLSFMTASVGPYTTESRSSLQTGVQLMRPPRPLMDVIRVYKYVDIPVLSSQVFADYTEMVRLSRATETMKVAVVKHKFDQVVSDDGFMDTARARLFDLMFEGPKARKRLFQNVFVETHVDTSRYLDDERVNYLELQGPVVSSVKLVKDVCRILGLSSTVDMEHKFTTADVKRNVAVLHTKLNEIMGHFRICIRSDSDVKEKQVRSMLKGMLTAWSGMSLHAEQTGRTATERNAVYSLKSNDEFVNLLVGLGGYAGVLL